VLEQGLCARDLAYGSRIAREVRANGRDEHPFRGRTQLIDGPVERAARKQLLEDSAVGDVLVRPPGIVDLDAQHAAHCLGVMAAVEAHRIDERAVDVEHHEVGHVRTAVDPHHAARTGGDVGSRPA